MSSKKLRVESHPDLKDSTLILGFSGWMDGGEVSTGTVNYLIDSFDVQECGSIEPQGFYIYSFPGDMEISELFRPFVKIENGIIKTFEPPESTFFRVPESNLILFTGKEPNLGWNDYADCILSFCKQFSVSRIYSLGSVAGLTPHTREPRITFSASNEQFRDYFLNAGLRPGNYDGPSSFTAYLTQRATKVKIDMVSLVAEIPAYIEGYNPRCVETSVRLMANFLDLKLDLDELHDISEQFEFKITELVQEQNELAEKIKELERDYDREAFDREMGDLKNWLRQQGLRAD